MQSGEPAIFIVRQLLRGAGGGRESVQAKEVLRKPHTNPWRKV